MEEIIVVLGPTASGKTKLAVKMAKELNAEIISADSRQVYRGMDIGTGKDLSEYGDIPYHLIDIVNAGEKYNLALFQQDFRKVADAIIAKGKRVILCGGTGLYIQSIIQNFSFTHVPVNNELRTELENYNNDTLALKLQEKGLQFDTRKRAIRALEIAEYNQPIPAVNSSFTFKVYGLNPEINERRERISQRLKHRLQFECLIDEVRDLLYEGLNLEILEYYGLEYKYIGRFLQGLMRYDEMVDKLEVEIHRFAKRQMTFFRSMEKKGIEIFWFPNDWSDEEKIKKVANG